MEVGGTRLHKLGMHRTVQLVGGPARLGQSAMNLIKYIQHAGISNNTALHGNYIIQMYTQICTDTT